MSQTLYRSEIEVSPRDDDSPEEAIEEMLRHVFDIPVYCVEYEDGVATVISPHDIEIVDGADESNPEHREAARKVKLGLLESYQREIYQDIQDRWGVGPDAETWTNDEVMEVTDGSGCYNTIKKVTRILDKEGLATEVGTGDGVKERRLVTE
ncbi:MULTISPECIES: hypothetical protein [Haloarcula]|uniref:hypothetical protein n=1 Tax=Haloarcula TaxID=2237 RepID=UPI0023E8A148|nr:hypothetical protein [Halomicroarcula sp. SHR3]